MVQDLIHQKIVDRCDTVRDWFKAQAKGLAFPFYSSFDVRDSGAKVAPVDANIFPAGFNNVCSQDQEAAVPIAARFLKNHYGSPKNIVLLAEEHTGNAYYWENVKALRRLLTGAGFDVVVAWAKDMSGPFEPPSLTPEQIVVHPAENRGGEVWSDGKKADLVISNNDFSLSHEEWSQGLTTPLTPPRELGWYRRRKDQFFEAYNNLVREFAGVIDLDPRLLSIATDRFDHFDVESEDSRNALADKVEAFLARIKTDYQELGVPYEPFVFVKNNAGTYGLAVTQVRSADEIRQWTYKSRKRMKAAKGGRDVESLVIQEGVPTRLISGNETAEPCIYTIGSDIVGGFLRAHTEKGPQENLNSPGAVFKKLCVSDLEVNISGCPMENVYGTVARLGVLAIAREAVAGDIQFRGYRLE